MQPDIGKVCTDRWSYSLSMIRYGPKPSLTNKPLRTTTPGHRWDLPVLHYHKIMVIYPYPFLVVIIKLFSCIIFINDVYVY